MKNDILTKIGDIPKLRDVLEHPLFLSMKKYRHHGAVSCYDHTLEVAGRAFMLSIEKNIDPVSSTRAALLHDFYLYDWHTDSPGLHGFKHPGISLKNARDYFSLNKVEENAILRHMWPLTPIPPAYPEAMIVSIADKAATLDDYWKSAKSRLVRTRHKGTIKKQLFKHPGLN